MRTNTKSSAVLLQTLYMDSVDYQKKKTAETLLMQNNLSHTPKARVGQSSENIVTQEPNSVNSEFLEDDEMRSDRDPDRTDGTVSNRQLLANALESVSTKDEKDL